MKAETERIGAAIVLLIVTFSAFAVLLSPAVFPTDFIYAGKQYEMSTLPSSYWRAFDLTQYLSTWNNSGNGLDVYGDETVWIGGHKMAFRWDRVAAVGNYIDFINHYGFGGWWEDAMNWYDESGDQINFWYLGYARINGAILDNTFEEFNRIKYTTSSGRFFFSIDVMFDFNTTKYSSPAFAWASDELFVVIGITPDNVNLEFNAWSLIGSLLTFQPIEIFQAYGTVGVWINYLLALPFWLMTAYVFITIVQRFIPFGG